MTLEKIFKRVTFIRALVAFDREVVSRDFYIYLLKININMASGKP